MIPNVIEAPTRQKPAAHRKRLPTPRSFRPDIQGLRAIAVVTVALYHADVPFLKGGYVGVDVFFVISGFLITRHLFDEASVRGRVRLANFYAKRFKRLLPPVVLVVGCSLLLAHYALPYDQLRSLIKDAYYTSFYGINYHFAVEGVQYQNASAPPSAFQHFWSLAVEEQFYAFWPVLISVCAILGRRRFRRGLTIGVVGALSIGTLAYSIAISATNHPVAYFSLQTRAWELGAGALVALTAQSWAQIPSNFSRLLGWAGLSAILVTAVVYSDRTIYPGWEAAIPVAGAALLIGSGVLRNSKTPETVLLERPFMQYGGKVSYAWYLWHWPMLIILPAWAGHSLSTWENVEIVCLAFWFAVLTYFLENTAHRSSWSVRKWASAGALMSSCVALFALVSGGLLPTFSTSGDARTVTALTAPNLPIVQAQISRSLMINDLPRNLTPALNQVSKDFPGTYDTKCFATLQDTTPRGCAFGDVGSSKVAVLVGDSHADQWIGPLAHEAKLAHWKIVEYAKAACSIAALKLFNPDLNREYRECDTWRAMAAADIIKLHPAMIIASQSDNVPGTSMSDSAWATVSTNTLKALAGASAKVVYIEDSDNDLEDPLTCLERYSTAAQKCTYQRDRVFTYPYRAPALQRKIQGAGFSYLPTLDFFCTSAWCPPVVGNMVVHRDQGHITNTYAMWLAPMFSQIFK
ncbi:MAG: acyltransferase family protein [Frankia sp.]